MKTLHRFEWAAAWLATKLFLCAVGGMALIVWFCEPMGWIIRTGSVLAVVAMWLLNYKIVLGFFERKRDTTKNVGAGERKSIGDDIQGAVVRSENRAVVIDSRASVPASRLRRVHSFGNPAAEDARQALINLEYHPRQARQAVQEAVRSGARDFESIFRMAQAGLRT